MNVLIHVADSNDAGYAQEICDLMYESAQVRGTGIARRSTEYVAEKINAGKAVLAKDGKKLVGFSYIESWGHRKFVANSGLIVHPDYRNRGVGKQIKRHIFDLSRKLYPHAKIFSITTGMAVMKMNTDLGFKPVPFSELTDDEAFWKGCEGCRNFDILQRNNYKMCLCTGLLFDPDAKPAQKAHPFAKKVVKPMIKKRKNNVIFKR